MILNELKTNKAFFNVIKMYTKNRQIYKICFF